MRVAGRILGSILVVVGILGTVANVIGGGSIERLFLAIILLVLGLWLVRGKGGKVQVAETEMSVAAGAGTSFAGPGG